jgi:hypothetical protein
MAVGDGAPAGTTTESQSTGIPPHLRHEFGRLGQFLARPSVQVAADA